jgi:hypothetical protein
MPLIDLYCLLTLGEGLSITYADILEMPLSDIFRAKRFVEKYRENLK